MENKDETLVPLGKYFAFFTKQYIGILSKYLEHLPIDRFFYPLYLIGKHSGEVTQKDLTELLNTDKVTVNRIIDFLLENEMIRKEVNNEDKRSYLIFIEEKAKPFVSEIKEAIEKTDETILATIENKDNFNTVLCNLYNGLKDKNFDDISLVYETNRKPKK